MQTIRPNVRRADVLFVRRTKTTDGAWPGYFFVAGQRVWINFRSMQEAERWRADHEFEMHFVI